MRTLSLSIGALVALVVSCGPSGAELKTAQDAHYKGDPSQIYAAVREAAAKSDFPEQMSDEGNLLWKSAGRWYTPDGQIDSTGGVNPAARQAESIQLAVEVGLVKDGDAFVVIVKPIAGRMRGLSSNPEPMVYNDPGTPGWVHTKVENLQIKIYERLKPFAAPSGGPAAPGSLPPATQPVPSTNPANPPAPVAPEATPPAAGDPPPATPK